MTVLYNTTKQEDVVKALNVELVENFTGMYDRLAELIGLFGVETLAAGTAIVQKKITGSLLNTTTADGSSGTAYIEGDRVANSKYSVTENVIGKASIVPYRKQTTGDAILKAGFENAIIRTDRKAVQECRDDIMTAFFAFMANGTTTAAGDGLQAALAYASAALGDALESAHEGGGDAVYFVNRQDAASYLANAAITTQETFGMDYLENFLGVRNVLLTNKVASGTVYATPVENIHVYGIDFAALGDAGLVYETDGNGLIGVAHEGAYDYVSAITNIARGALFVPEVTDFIVKATISEAETTTTTTTTTTKA